MTSASTKQSSNVAWPALFAVAGVLLLIVGFLWPTVDDPRRNWTDDQADEYTAASLALHQATHSHSPDNDPSGDHAGHDHAGHDHAGHDDAGGDRYEQNLAAAHQRFEQIKQQLESARQGPQNMAFWLKFIGGTLVGLAALTLALQRADS